ncbi:Rv3654c family TadE-like protein [Streptomyces sp. NPDC005012]|uniref:Rv3654c family TadE-like protein n=1 Tax=Streptomyces sp. NPDC005012 TaxID=3154558 RepID=UPI0033B27B58
MRCRDDRGSATVWAGGAICALCVVFAAVLAMSEVVLVRHRAAAGADLAALAAAGHWPDGPAAACLQADRVAEAQRVRLVRCGITGEVADVVVAAGHGPFAATSRARAGPPAPSPPPPPRGTPPRLPRAPSGTSAPSHLPAPAGPRRSSGPPVPSDPAVPALSAPQAPRSWGLRALGSPSLSAPAPP